MKQIYRMETRQGEGVFMSGAVHRYADTTGDNPQWMPPPYEDGIPDIHHEEHCAFENPSQLLTWFKKPEYFNVLDDERIFICIYEVEDQYVRKGRNQVVFNKYRASLKERHRPSAWAAQLNNLL